MLLYGAILEVWLKASKKYGNLFQSYLITFIYQTTPCHLWLLAVSKSSKAGGLLLNQLEPINDLKSIIYCFKLLIKILTKLPYEFSNRVKLPLDWWYVKTLLSLMVNFGDILFPQTQRLVFAAISTGKNYNWQPLKVKH